MLHDQISLQDIVDRDCAQEFLREATRLASSRELEDTYYRLEWKCRVFQRLLAPETLPGLDEKEFTKLLGLVFFLRRRPASLMQKNSREEMLRETELLLYGEGPVGPRLARFARGVRGVREAVAVSFGSELLHFVRPERYWLWTTWIWDPKTTGGALPLVLEGEAGLAGGDIAETYEKVGRALAAVDRVGHAEGFSNLGRGSLGTDLFLACVYTVYMYAMFRMRLSEEFNRILPGLPEFTRRILGVQNVNVDEGDV